MFGMIVWCILLLIAGYFIGAYFLIQPLIILRCAIPVTKMLAQECKMNTAPITKRLVTTLAVHVALLIGSSVLVYLFAPVSAAVSFAAGILFVLLAGFRQTGINEKNCSDYMQAYSRYFPQDKESFEEAAFLIFRLFHPFDRSDEPTE